MTRSARDRRRPWTFPLAGERIVLRPLRAADLSGFHGYRADPAVARYQGWSPMSVEAAGVFIASMAAVDGPRPGEWIQLAIALREPDELIGDLGLHVSHDQATAQIGYSCAVRHQGRGLMGEAVRLLIRNVFDRTACTSVIASVDPDNERSLRLLARLGFAPAPTSDNEQQASITFVLHRPTQPDPAASP